MGRSMLDRRGIAGTLLRVLVLAFVIAGFLAGSPSRSAAQAGCCYCDNCPVTVGPYCTDLMSSSPSCAEFCISQRGCAVLVFSPDDTCGGGCGDKPIFLSPTPTATPTDIATTTPTTSPTPSVSSTPRDTPTPVYCCQGDGGNNRCGIPNPSNQPLCLANETPIADAACLAGQCRTFTPTFTQTNTPTVTNTRTNTPTPTWTPTFTPTPTLFMGNSFNCDRITGTSRGQMYGKEVTVIDSRGVVRKKMVLKPKYLCSPAASPTPGVIENPQVYLTCYKSKDVTKIKSEVLTLRNQFEDLDTSSGGTPTPMPLVATIIKGDLICLPSYLVPTKTPTPPLTPFTPTRTPTKTP